MSLVELSHDSLSAQLSLPTVGTVFDAYLFDDRLPSSIEAFFYLDESECNERKCITPAREAHASFLKRYPSASARVPLLAFDPYEPEQPFSDAPTAPPQAGGVNQKAGFLSDHDITCLRCPLCCLDFDQNGEQ